jgi:magnesium transporter
MIHEPTDLGPQGQKRPKKVSVYSEVTAWLYDAGGQDSELPFDRVSLRDLGAERLLWVDVSHPRPSLIVSLQGRLGLKKGVISRLVDNERQLFLDNYGDYFGMSVLLPPQDKQKPDRFSILMGSNWLVTLSSNLSPQFTKAFREQDKGETDIGRLTSAQLLATLLDWHLAAFFAEVSNIEERVDALDEDILKERGQTAILREMVSIRRSISALRRVLAEQRPVFYALSRPDIGRALDENARRSFERLGERLERAIDEVERTRDVLVGSFDLFTSLSAQTTNELVKILTFATVLLGGFGAIAGLLGMNFELPLYQSGTPGFLAVIGILSMLSGASLWIARRRGWI